MKIVDRDHPITLDELSKMAAAMFGDLVKAVVDVERQTVAVDAELHSDEEACPLESRSAQERIFGGSIFTPAIRAPTLWSSTR